MPVVETMALGAGLQAGSAGAKKISRMIAARKERIAQEPVEIVTDEDKE